MSDLVAKANSVNVGASLKKVLVVLIDLDQVIHARVYPREARGGIRFVKEVPLRRNVEPVDEPIDVQNIVVVRKMLAKRPTKIKGYRIDHIMLRELGKPWCLYAVRDHFICFDSRLASFFASSSASRAIASSFSGVKTIAALNNLLNDPCLAGSSFAA